MSCDHIERDSIGEMRIPETADYGIHTARVPKIALKTRRAIREVALSEDVMTEAQLAEAFATDNHWGGAQIDGTAGWARTTDLRIHNPAL